MRGTRPPSRLRKWLNLLLALFIVFGVGTVAARGSSGVPPLGPALNPGTGVWTAAADARLPHDETLRIPGLRESATVSFEPNGAAHIQAASQHDLFFVTGYVHARFRLFQMDLERRQGEGLLSQIVGSQALPLDRFELRLGLLRTARLEWRTIGPESRAAIEAYARGVNARLDEDKRDRTIPFLFHMLGYTPTHWTPIDTLVVKGDMAQDLDLTSSPLDYAVLIRKLGYNRTMRWFPVLPPNRQRPYDPGPYRGKSSPAPLPSQVQLAQSDIRRIAAVDQMMSALGVLHSGGNSNNWAVSGARTASGKPLMAGDPHLHQTLPAIWYELTQDAPNYHVSGVSIPGTPVVLIGRNRHISWSLTNTQNQATLYYLERTDRAHPRQYFWHGAWHRMRRVSYEIPVKGESAAHLNVDLTVHGPILDDDRMPGRTVSMYWVANLPSDDLGVLLRIGRARNFSQFRNTLRQWHAPSQNFIYADDANHIGLISAGYYPLIRKGAEWLPLPGTGESDVIGTIPFSEIPQAYDPPDHLLFTANQRPVEASYPYYIGTTLDFFDNGYRADRIYQVLHARHHLTVHDMEQLQNDTHDYLAMRLKPVLLRTFGSIALNPTETQARETLARWDGAMDAGSAGAAIWWTFWSRYLHDTFDPWWTRYHVPSNKFDSLKVGTEQIPLSEDLEQWTLQDPNNPALSLPDGTKRSARAVMAKAFREAATDLQHRFGREVGSWRWGRLHTRELPSLSDVPGLGYGPRPSGSDLWTVNAASGELQADHGPSWRMIVDWGTGRAEGVYPGGQSENPASPWYKNLIATWWNGRYYPLRDAQQGSAQPGSVTWRLLP